MIQVERRFTRHEIEVIMLLSIEEGLVLPRPSGQENGRQERRNRPELSQMGPMNEDRAALMLDSFRGMMRRANNWRETLQALKSAGCFLTTMTEVTIDEAWRVLPQGPPEQA